jgi:urease accessory protein UreE
MGNPIGTINVRVNSGAPTVQRVTLSSGVLPAKVSLAPTTTQQMKNLIDLNIPPTANNGDVIVYNANNQTFQVEPASEGIPDIDGGTF